MSRQSSPPTSSPIQREVRTDVYVRPAVYGGSDYKKLTKDSGFEWDPLLRVNQVRWQTGVNPGHVTMEVVPFDRDQSIESLFSRYNVDDQVAVYTTPLDAFGGEGGASGGRLMFAGALQRTPFTIDASGGRENEQLRLVAVPFPVIDNQVTGRIIRGQWYYHPSFQTATRIRILETPSMPAVFNFNGRPNMHGGQSFDHPTFNFDYRAFTDPDNAAATWWTVRDALQTLIAVWIYGPDGNIDRQIVVEEDTRDALNGTKNTGRWGGLDDRLPEVDVHGLGPLEAIQRVCAEAGFEMANLPRSGQPDQHAYELKLWRQNAGPENDLKLERRGQFSSKTADQLRRNDVSMVRGQYDAVPVVNEVRGFARSLVEVSVPLKPLWNPGDVDGATVDATLLDDKGDSSYHEKHVAGREQFAEFGHVGRLWGLDCSGAWAGDGNGYQSGLYQHDANGFDWVSFLDINNSALATERSNLGITDDIVWSRRVRQALPLRDASQRLVGADYKLEVSEDGGSTWHDVTSLNFRTLDSWFGIELTGSAVENLAAVNIDKLRTSNKFVALPTESWWQLILNEQLQFRLTCVVEGDHAARYDATKQASAGSDYEKGQYLELDFAEHWRSTKSVFNSSGSWQKTKGQTITAGNADVVTSVQQAAERKRDQMESQRISIAASTWLMMFDRWRVGDRITGLTGRNLGFTTNADESRAPSVVGLTFNLGGSSRQLVRLHLSDTAQTEGIA